MIVIANLLLISARLNVLSLGKAIEMAGSSDGLSLIHKVKEYERRFEVVVE